MEFGDDTYDSLVILPPRGKTSDTAQKEPFLSPPRRSPSPQLAPQPSKSLTSELHIGQCRGRVGICRQTHLPPLCGLSFPRLLGFAGEANRVAADQQVRRKTVTGRQTELKLSHLGGIADLLAPIRFQSLGNSANGRFIVGEEFGRVLVRPGTPVRPHSAGFQGANRHAERRQFLSERFREASNGPFRSMVGCACQVWSGGRRPM